MNIKILNRKKYFSDFDKSHDSRLEIIILDWNEKELYFQDEPKWYWKVIWRLVVRFDDIDNETIKIFQKDVDEWTKKLFSTETWKEIFDFIESYRKDIELRNVESIWVCCKWWKCRSAAVWKAIWKTFWFDVSFIDDMKSISSDFLTFENMYYPNELVFNLMMKLSNNYSFMN